MHYLVLFLFRIFVQNSFEKVPSLFSLCEYICSPKLQKEREGGHERDMKNCQDYLQYWPDSLGLQILLYSSKGGRDQTLKRTFVAVAGAKMVIFSINLIHFAGVWLIFWSDFILQGWALRSFPFRTFRSFPFKKENVTFFSVLFSRFW